MKQLLVLAVALLVSCSNPTTVKDTWLKATVFGIIRPVERNADSLVPRETLIACNPNLEGFKEGSPTATMFEWSCALTPGDSLELFCPRNMLLAASYMVRDTTNGNWTWEFADSLLVTKDTVWQPK